MKSESSDSRPPWRRGPATIPIVLFLILIAALATSLTLSDRPPYIDRIVPAIGVPGAVLTIEGKHFGPRREGASLTIAGIRPTSAAYLEWKDTRIRLQIPDNVTSGLVTIRNRAGESNSPLFTNRGLIPVVLTELTRPGFPHIDSVEPPKAAVGSIVTISGLNFGLARGEGHVFFSAIAPVDEGDGAERFVPASTIDFDYESWTEQSVRVRVPDGSTSGTLRIVTDRGESNSEFFEVVTIGGIKSIREKVGFQIATSVSVDRVISAPGGAIELWIPGPTATPAQRNIETESEPVAKTINGLSHFLLEGVVPESLYGVAISHWLDRYTLETRVSSARVVQAYDKSRKLYRVYTDEDKFVPSSNEEIVEAAASAVAGQRNPYLAAERIYRYLLNTMSFDRKSPAKGVAGAFLEAMGDSSDYALLYCAMLRAAGIPARPVTGLLIYDRNRTIRHMWAEFYIEGLGWIPADPLLGDGVTIGESPARESASSYYFGNLDSGRITFTRGIAEAQSTNGGLTRAGVPSLQSVHESAGVGVESYRSEWSQIEVIDFW